MLGELLSNGITLLRSVNIKSLNVEQGLLERSWLCGVLPFEILASHILSQLGVIIVQVCDYWYNLSTNSDSCFLNSTIFFHLIFSFHLCLLGRPEGGLGTCDCVWGLWSSLPGLTSSHSLALTITR